MTIFSVYRNHPFSVKIIKDRYWDTTINKSISTDVAETVTLTPYDGLESQVNNNASAPLLFISEGLMPDNAMAGADHGCLMPEGNDYLITSKGYYNIPCSGGLKVNYETGVAEGFSATNKIDLGHCLASNNYTLIQKVYFDGEMRVQTIWQADSGKYVGVNSGKLGVYISSWILSENVLTSGIYWVKATYSDRTFKLYCLADDSETYMLDTLPELASWVLELTVTDCDSPLASSSTLRLSSASETFWGGKMYLSGAFTDQALLMFQTNKKEIYKGMLATGVSCDGQAQNYNIFYKDGEFVADTAEAKSGYRWCGTAAMKQFNPNEVLRKRYTVVGSPTISFLDLNMSAFSANNYIISDVGLPVAQYFAVNLKIVCKCKPSTVTSASTLFGNNSSDGGGFGIHYNNWRICGSSVVSGGQAVNGKTYWLMFIQAVNQGAKLYYIEDNGSYTLDTLPELSEWSLGPSANESIFKMNGTKVRIGNDYNTPNNYFSGSIDLMNTCIYSSYGSSSTGGENWSVYWKPFSAVSTGA